MNALEARGLKKHFSIDGKSLEIVKQVSLVVPEGAFHAIMGPSGSGKTTLMNLLAGLLPADEGELLIGGESLRGKSDAALTCLRRRTMGIIFQDYNLIPTLTVEENIALPALLDGQRVSEEKMSQLLSLVRLTHRRQQPADRLSGGEAQRTAIARAFVLSPSIILADEPTGNLDSPAAKEFCATLTRLNAELKTAILLVSHDAQVAAAAQKVHFLRDGAICGEFETKQDALALAARYLELMQCEQ